MPRKKRPALERDLNDYWFDNPKARQLWSRRKVFEDGLKVILGPNINPGTRRLLLEMWEMEQFTRKHVARRVCGLKVVDKVLAMMEQQELIVRLGKHVRMKGRQNWWSLSPWGKLLLLEFVREAEYFIWRTGGRLRLQSDDPILRPAGPWLAQAAGGIDMQALLAKAFAPPKESTDP